MLISMQSFSMSASELTKTFDIAPQSLNDALVSFAQQANIELLFSADSVRGLNSQNLQGRMTAEQGLKILLKDSGLNCRFINNHTAALLTPSSAAPGSDNPSLMDSLEVTGNRIHQPSGTDSNQYNPS
jgi:iron complex outermembrane receptor protein